MRDSGGSSNLPDHMVKGNLVENIVAMFHETEGISIQTKVLLPSRRSPSDRREIDVLLTGSFASYPVRVGIECKNYKSRIGTGKIDEFAGKLDDVGIPTQHGIYVTVSGYTKGAINRARDLGIRLLTLEGLTPDRLTSVVHESFQSIVYLLLSVDRIVVRSTTREADPWELMWTKDSDGNYSRGVFDIIWGMWRNGDINYDLGQRALPVDLPTGWSWHTDSADTLAGIEATVRVRGLVLTLKGTANQHTLTDTLSPETRRIRIAGSFEVADSLPVIVAENEQELRDATKSEALITFQIGRMPLPRILALNRFYWPPSQSTVDYISRKASQLFIQGDYEFTGLSQYSLMDIEGPNLARIWEPIWSEHPGASDPDWPFIAQDTPPRLRIRKRSPSTNPRRKAKR